MNYYKCDNCGAISAGEFKLCPACHKPHRKLTETEYRTLLKSGGNLPEPFKTYLTILPNNSVKFYDKLPIGGEFPAKTACYQVTDDFEISLLPSLIKRQAAKRIVNSYLDGSELPDNIKFIWYISKVN